MAFWVPGISEFRFDRRSHLHNISPSATAKRCGIQGLVGTQMDCAGPPESIGTGFMEIHSLVPEICRSESRVISEFHFQNWISFMIKIHRCVKLHKQNSFWTMISAFYGDFEEEQVRTLIESICFVNSPRGNTYFCFLRWFWRKTV